MLGCDCDVDNARDALDPPIQGFFSHRGAGIRLQTRTKHFATLGAGSSFESSVWPLGVATTTAAPAAPMPTAQDGPALGLATAGLRGRNVVLLRCMSPSVAHIPRRGIAQVRQLSGGSSAVRLLSPDR